MQKCVGLNIRQIISVFAQHLGIFELAYFRQLSYYSILNNEIKLFYTEQKKCSKSCNVI